MPALSRSPALSAPAALGAALLLGSLPILARPASLAGQTTLQIQGTGTVEVDPDRARISFAVETEAAGAREAAEANARLMDRVVASVRETDLPGLRVETSGYSLTPRYRPRQADQPQEIAGYTARNHVLVLVDDVEAVGRLVDTALGAGANRVAGLSFEVRDAEPHRIEALRRAIRQARSEAEAVAEALELRLGEPSDVSTHYQMPRPPSPYMAVAMERALDAPTTPMEAGLQAISATVNLVYRLYPR